MANRKIQTYQNKGHATPVPTWMFQVYFYFGQDFISKNDIPTDTTSLDSFTCIKVDLPKFTINQKTVSFLGASMNVNVYRDLSGETTLDFWCAANEKTGRNPDGIINFMDAVLPGHDGTLTDYFRHDEFMQVFDKIDIIVMNIDGSTFRKIRLYNPTVQEFNFAGEMSYEGEEGLRWTLTVHYDAWEDINRL
jgi:hypothetical protein